MSIEYAAPVSEKSQVTCDFLSMSQVLRTLYVIDTEATAIEESLYETSVNCMLIEGNALLDNYKPDLPLEYLEAMVSQQLGNNAEYRALSLAMRQSGVKLRHLAAASEYFQRIFDNSLQVSVTEVPESLRRFL
jgi:hypothetical protein